MNLRFPLLSAALLAGALLLVPSGSADASRPGDAARFQTWVGYDVGRFPTAVAAADLNGDGLADAAWARDDFFENSVSVTMNLGDGTLGSPRTYRTTAQSTDIAAADLDGDGDVDLAVSARGNGLENSTVDLLLNDGTGAFTHTTAAGGSGPEAITAGDVDADGDTDLVLANYHEHPGSTVTVLRNSGDATFAAESTVVGFRVRDVVVGDLTGDGSSDIGASRLNEEINRYELHVLEQRADGTFAPDGDPQEFDVSTNGAVGSPSLTAGDLDADSDLDLVVAGGATLENAVLTNDGTGTFAVRTYAAPMVKARLADTDRDGDVDIVGVGGGGIRGTATLQLNNGDGTFAAPVSWVTGSNPLGLDVADLQGDGRPDLLVAARDIGSGVTHRQLIDETFAAPDGGRLFAPSVGVVTGDVDGDGDVDVAAAVDGDAGRSIRVLANDGDGNLTEVAQLPTGAAPRSLSLVDLDEDDDLDLGWLAGRCQGQVVATALNGGDGTFAPPTTRTVSTRSDHLSFGDLDGDGDADQLVGNEDLCQDAGADQVSVSLNNGSGGFATERLEPMAQYTGDLAVADVDKDGTPDLVGASALATTDDIAVALGTGGGSLAVPVLTTTGAAHREIVVRDLDADGDVDIASSTYNNATAVLFGDRTATFSEVDFLAGESISGYRNAVGIAVGDIDGDAILDIVVANESGSDVGVHAGLGDGAFEERQVRYGMRPRVTDVALADLDRDGVLDVISPAQLPGVSARTVSKSAAQTAAPSAATEPAAGLTVLEGARPRCTIVGTPGADVLVGTRRTDVICGRGGDDRLIGATGSDVLRGQAGADHLVGGDGFDVLRGGPGDDLLNGRAHDDGLRGDAGHDRLLGEGGSDTLDLRDANGGAERGNAGPGADHCVGNRSDVLVSCS